MTVFVPNSTILYVFDVETNTTLYREILDHEPVKTYPGFSVFKLPDEISLGLQTVDEIEPAAESHVGGTELSLSDAERADVDRLYAQWKASGIPAVLGPIALEFGYTFVVTNPDEHRLRVCAINTPSFV